MELPAQGHSAEPDSNPGLSVPKTQTASLLKRSRSQLLFNTVQEEHDGHFSPSSLPLSLPLPLLPLPSFLERKHYSHRIDSSLFTPVLPRTCQQ